MGRGAEAGLRLAPGGGLSSFRGGRGRKGAGKGGGSKSEGRGGGIANKLASLDKRSIEHESNIEILRAQRAAARKGRSSVHDAVRENEGVDEDDPLISVDDGIRIEPFNMRREMAEGHFDEGGFYITNKDEEKEVTDAWLDTIDKAQKQATFQQVERQKRAEDTAVSRLTALSKNLGKDEDGDEGEEGEEDEEKAKERKSPGGSDADATGSEVPATKDASADDEEEAPGIIVMLDNLVSELAPLETPVEALRRWGKDASASSKKAFGGAATSDPPLKTRARVRQRRSQIEAGVVDKVRVVRNTTSGRLPGGKRRRLSEFGYDDGEVKDTVSEEPAEQGKEVEEGGLGTCGLVGSASVIAKGVASTTLSLATSTASEQPGALVEPDSVAIAAAAERVAAEEKARAEAAVAAAADARVWRVVVHADLDAKGNPEFDAIVNLNADDQQKAKEHGETSASEAALGRERKRPAELDPVEIGRRAKIERLTDLCDRLLERGVLVYDSTREQLCIELRERQGENLHVVSDRSEQIGDTIPGKTLTGNKTAERAMDASCVAEPTCEDSVKPLPSAAVGVVYTNRRCQPAKEFTPSDNEGSALLRALQEGASSELMVEASAASGSTLLWQFRWTDSLEQVHGPFDSTTMQGWVQVACFSHERPAEVRQCDGTNTAAEACWHAWDTVDFSLYL